MKQTAITGACAALLAIVPISEAMAEVRADHMAKMCEAIATTPTTEGLQRTYENGFCRGLFEVVERLIESDSRIGDPPYPPSSTVCRPPGWMQGWGDRTGTDILIAVFVRHVARLPGDRRQEGFLNIAIESLERAFPCENPPTLGRQ